jgi:hypothetical protein
MQLTLHQQPKFTRCCNLKLAYKHHEECLPLKITTMIPFMMAFRHNSYVVPSFVSEFFLVALHHIHKQVQHDEH